ncbi:hypothetical protein, partial [Escherichia coli]|uniref:hypothetical protein n=1 Tax=Escherichia coli TaxID=562 RepID=UPI001954913F
VGLLPSHLLEAVVDVEDDLEQTQLTQVVEHVLLVRDAELGGHLLDPSQTLALGQLVAGSHG